MNMLPARIKDASYQRENIQDNSLGEMFALIIINHVIICTRGKTYPLELCHRKKEKKAKDGRGKGEFFPSVLSLDCLPLSALPRLAM